MKILILKIQTIGDTLLITPLIRNLYLHDKNVLIDVVVNKGTIDILKFNKKIRNIFIYSRKTYRSLTKFKRLYKEFKFIRKIRRERYDVVIDLDQSDKGAILTMLSGAKIKIGSSKIGLRLVRNTYTHYLPERFSKHMVDSNLDPLKILNFPIVDKKVEIFFGAESDVAITKKLNGVSQFIHIHPFSKLDLKEVDSRSLAKIIDYCELELEVKVVITSGDLLREIHRVSKILSLCKSDPINLSANLTLNEVTALNKRALFFLGVDTALMHISAANSTPVLAFFGPTSPKVWGPWDNDLHFHNFLEYKEFQAVGIHRIYTDVSCYIARNKGYLERSMIKPDISLIRRQILVMLNENINT